MRRVDRWLAIAVVVGLLSPTVPAAGQTPTTKALPKPPAPTAATQVKSSAMTNRDVIDMVAAGLSDQLIVASIRRTARHAFDLSPQGLIALKKAAVSEAVIAVMLDPSAPPASAAPEPARPSGPPGVAGPPRTGTATVERMESSDPTAPHPPGIYVDLGSSEGGLVQLEPAAYSGGKTGGVFKSVVTAGIAKAKWKAEIRGPRANQRIRTATPTFYFYFEVTNAGLSNQGTFYGGASASTSPNEFVFAKFTATRSGRELIVNQMGAYGASTGARSEDTVDMKLEKLAPGIYRVTPVQPLAPGEYGIFHAGSMAAVGPGGGGTTGRVFDFGVDLR
jgi:hypothetical protein